LAPPFEINHLEQIFIGTKCSKIASGETGGKQRARHSDGLLNNRDD